MLYFFENDGLNPSQKLLISSIFHVRMTIRTVNQRFCGQNLGRCLGKFFISDGTLDRKKQALKIDQQFRLLSPFRS